MIMRSIRGALVALAFTLPVATAHADDTKIGGGGETLRDLTYGFIGVNRTDLGFDNIGSLVNISFATGVHIPTIDWLGAELAGSATVIPGKNSSSSSSGGGGSNCGGLLQPPCPTGTANTADDASIFDMGIYAVVRTPGRLYATARLGWRYFQSSVDDNNNTLYDERSGVAFGVGAGWRWGQTLSGVEITYTRISSDVNQIGAGIVYGFGGGHY